MKNGLLKVLCVTTALAMLVAFSAPQVGKRKGGSTGGGTTGGSSGGSNGGSTGGQVGTSGGGGRVDPPPVRTNGGGNGNGGGGGQVDPTGGGFGWPSTTGGGGTVIVGGGNQTPSVLGHRRGHSGVVQYGTTNNSVIHINGVRIERPGSINPGMQRRILDQERVGLVYNGYRVGYYHYNRNWCDDNFNYPFYVFNPWQQQQQCVCSPWYYYASLPPYINSTRIIYINNGFQPYEQWQGDNYNWSRPDRYDRYNQRSGLDYAINDITDAFERHDNRALDRLVPRDGSVALYFDGKYAYSLNPDDFYDLYQDGINNAQTSRYNIIDVQSSRNNSVRVLAKHEYNDPWGQRNYAYHTYYLQQEGRDWVIREFGVSNNRPW